MEESREKGRRLSLDSLIIKTWERCKSIRRSKKICSIDSQHDDVLINRKHVSGDLGKNGGKQCWKRARKGCFPVYVGQEKRRFVIKAEYANHPLFLELLEEAESEYGFGSSGSLVLPCGVDLFCEVLLAIDCGAAGYSFVTRQFGFGFSKGHAGCRLLNGPREMTAINVGKLNI